MRASRLASCAAVLWIGFVAFPLDAALAQGKPHGKETPAKAGKGEPDVMDDVDGAIRALETNDYATFLDKYMPVEALRRIREQDQVASFAKAMAAEKETKERLLAVLKQMKKSTPEYDKSRGLATFTFDPSADEAAPAADAPKTPPPKVTPGFGKDLTKALAEAQKTLAAKNYAAFVEKMYPPSAIAAIGENGAESIAAQLKSSPTMAEKMAEELKAIQSLKPKMEDGGRTAVFQLTAGGGKSKGRTVKFSLIGNDWRFFDAGEPIAAKIAELRLAKARGSTVTIKMERIGGNWRLIEFAL